MVLSGLIKMLEKLKKTLEEAPIVKKGDYNYFVHPVSDGIPAVDPSLLEEITDALIKKINFNNIDKIVAVEAMGIHLATVLSLKTNIPFVVIRKRYYGLPGERQVHQKTGYGESNLYINDLKEGENIILIDDVVSTGGTLISIINTLKEMKINLNVAVAVIEKGEGKKIVEEEVGIPILSLVKLDVINGKVVIESLND